MLNTTPISTLDSINPDLLFAVSGGCGGCHGHHCCGGSPVTQQTIVNMPQILPQVAAPAAPAPAPVAPAGDVVSTNVSLNGQPVASA